MFCPKCGQVHARGERHPHLTRLLLTVENTFAIAGRGVVLAPFLPTSEARPLAFFVELHRPDGSIVRAKALAQIPFVSPMPKVLFAHVMLLETEKSDVPVGTEVWVR